MNCNEERVKEIQAYLEEHRISERLEEALEHILLSRPSNPVPELAALLLKLDSLPKLQGMVTEESKGTSLTRTSLHLLTTFIEIRYDMFQGQ